MGETHALDGKTSVEEAVLTLVQQTKKSLVLYSPELTPSLFGGSQFYAEVKRITLSGPRASVRFLVHNPRSSLAGCAQLVSLVQRMSSVCGVRNPLGEDLEYHSAFLVGDSKHLLFQQIASIYQGHLSLNSARSCVEPVSYFDEVWERALPDSNFRALSI